MTLIRFNLMSFVVLNCALSFDTNSNQILEADADTPWNLSILQSAHRSEMHIAKEIVEQKMTRECRTNFL